MLDVTLLAPRILGRLLNFLKIFVPVLRRISFAVKVKQGALGVPEGWGSQIS